MTKLLDFLFTAGMVLLGVTLAAMLVIAVVGFWVHVMPEVWRAI